MTKAKGYSKGKALVLVLIIVLGAMLGLPTTVAVVALWAVVNVMQG